MGKKKTNKTFKNLPDEKKFLWLIANNVTPNDILYLSELDYGHDQAKHAERIKYFKQTLDTSNFDYWHPMEVLELNRWSRPGYLDMIGHGRRAFSCAGLMACYFDGVGEPIGSLDVLLPLFESLICLDLPDWQKGFSNFLSDGISKTKLSEDIFTLQLALFLTVLSESKDSKVLKTAYDQLMEDEEAMLIHHWQAYSNKTWDAALRPKVVRPAKIVDTFITHSTASLFSAKYVHHKAEQLNEPELVKNLKSLAHRIFKLGNDDVDERFPDSTIYL